MNLARLAKGTVRRAVAKVRRFGRDVSDHDYSKPLAAAVLRERINLVLDVGANIGQTGSALRRAGYKGKIVSYEPQKEEFKRLCETAASDNQWDCVASAIGNQRGVVEMQISGYSPSSSLLKMGSKHIERWPVTVPVGTEEVQVMTLDEATHGLAISNSRVMLKIDVQGYEFAVLAGAKECLQHIHAAYVELQFAPLYDGQSRYYEVMQTLECAGLRFVGLFSVAADPKTGNALFGDGLFIRTGE